MTLNTMDLLLRTVADGDAPEVARMWEFEKGEISIKEAREAIAGMMANHAKNRPGRLYHLCFAVFEKDGDKIIGWCGLDGKAEAGVPQIFYLLDKDYRGRGFASQCAKKLLEYAFGAGGLDVVYGGCDKNNVASFRVMIKAGMLHHGFDDESGDPQFHIDAASYRRHGGKYAFRLERPGVAAGTGGAEDVCPGGDENVRGAGVPDAIGEYGLSVAVVSDILSHIGNTRVDVLGLTDTVGIPDAFYGGRGKKTIVRAVYIEDGEKRAIDLFVKRHCEKFPNEAAHYYNLSKFAAPIPKLFAYYYGDGENDVIVTEAVTPLQIKDDSGFMLDRDVFEPFIRLTAEFNATRVGGEYKTFLSGRYDLVEDELASIGAKLQNIYELVSSDNAYTGLRRGISRGAVASMLAVHEKLLAKIRRMEKGLYHWDHAPRNTGRSDAQKRSVVFDLEDTLWAPRFFNIGMWIGGEDRYDARYAPREELAGVYLGVYNASSGANASIDNMLDECRSIYEIDRFRHLLWNFHECGPEPYERGDAGPEEYNTAKEEMVLYYADYLANLKI